MTKIGTIGWTDLTVPDAGAVRDFYADVVGWTATGLSMGEYEDYCMIPPDSDAAAVGICHARGANANLPAQWLIYIYVEDLDRSMNAVNARGGKVIAGPRSAGEQGRYCIIQDPAGAHAALFEAKKSGE